MNSNKKVISGATIVNEGSSFIGDVFILIMLLRKLLKALLLTTWIMK